MKKSKTLNELVKEALFLVDNCVVYKKKDRKELEDDSSSQHSGSPTRRSTSKPVAV